MTTPVTTAPDVPAAQPLSRLGNVELMKTGTWNASTGRHTFTTEDLSNAVAALECPAVRRPVLKLGHTDPRFDGEPAVGWLANMATTDDGHTLVADFVGMPGWLGPILASAFPDRSIEGQWHYRCALGHDHGFVLTGLALLGVSNPAIGTLASLQDVASLYGVDVAAADAGSGTPFTVELKGNAMSDNEPRVVAASVTTEDVRRAYYDDAPWEYWIEEMCLDPLQLIVVDDQNGDRMRVPVIVAPDGDGVDGVTFGDPTKVVVRYEDVPSAGTTAPAGTDPAADDAGQTAAASAPQVIRYASRAESRPGQKAGASTPAAPADGATTEGGSDVEITNEQLAALRTALGLADDADLAAIIAAVQALTAVRGTLGLEDTASVEDIVAAIEALASSAGDQSSQTAAAAAGSVVSLDREAFAAMQREAALGRAAHERQQREDRERTIDQAIAKGKIPPARRDHWLALLAADPKGTADTLKAIPDETVVSLSEIGHTVSPDGANEDLSWFGTAPTASNKEG